MSYEDYKLIMERITLMKKSYLDLSLDVLNGVRRLDLESDSLPGKGLDENLHFQQCFVRIFL